MKAYNSFKRRKGQAFVEFAVSVVILMLLAFGTVDLARGISSYQRMTAVAREGGRVFVKSNIDTKNFDEAALKATVDSKVYSLIKQAMLPDKLDENGAVYITVARRIKNPSTSTSSDGTDQLKITHVFDFPGTIAGGNGGSKINYTDDSGSKIIAGAPATSNFLPVTTIRLDEELIIVELIYKQEFITPIASLVPGLSLNILYDRAVF
jgi:Flp pilus assembly protein TadG